MNQIKLTDEQENELIDIGIQMAMSDESDLDYFKNMFESKDINVEAYKKVKDKYGDYVQTLEDYVYFFDKMNEFKNDKVLSSILSSDQYARLMNYAPDNMTENDLDTMIYMNYQEDGKTGDALYNKILELIE